MLNALIRTSVIFLLWLRYRITVSGLKDLWTRGTRGILFLPSHPALIDPFIVLSVLNRRFRPMVIADNEAINLPVVRPLAIRFGTYPIPSMAKDGLEARRHIEEALQRCAQGLKLGENWILYPAGHILTSNREYLGANSAVETILREAPATRIVLLRTRGLWGSGFSRADGGRPPEVGRHLLRGIWRMLANFIFFAPRRHVSLEFLEPSDFPRDGSRIEINRYLEEFYNREPLPKNLYVPYTIWQRDKSRELPEPKETRLSGDIDDVPPATRDLILAHLREISSRKQLTPSDRLADDLGLDSLLRAELMLWLEGEFGFTQGHADSLQTVSDVLLAALGQTGETTTAGLKPVPEAWFAGRVTDLRLTLPASGTIADAFLTRAASCPDTVIIADQQSGTRTYRELITAMMVLHPIFKRLPGTYIGIMLPASVAATVVYLATLFAGKIPVLVNWTVGARNVRHSLDLLQVQQVVTAQQLLLRLKGQGIDLGELEDRFLALEEVAAGISKGAKLLAWLRGRFSWAPLRHAAIADTAAVLFTSGSESLPKAVPLSQTNLLTNMHDVLQMVDIHEYDRMLGILPPFHSFGLTVNMLLALCAGVRTAYYPNPTEGPTLARMIEAYQVTLFIGTPTFIHGIIRASTRAQLDSLRLIVTGAEECPPRIYDAIINQCPQATVLEGYGITECSPVVSVNDPAAPIPFTIGKLLPSLEAAIIDLDNDAEVSSGAAGQLLLRGPSIFHGYLGNDAPDPFITYDSKRWYRTGDLVSKDAHGVLTFRGRLKRFVKIGGEMISLPAIESVLQNALPMAEIDGPTLAVLATTTTDRPELVLCTTVSTDREEVNRLLRDAGLSPLHHIRQVIHLDAIPVLGTGKTDYRALQQRLTTPESSEPLS